MRLAHSTLSLSTREERVMARPLGNPYASRESTIDDLREQFLARAHAKNLAPRTIEWYERHTASFRDWCAA